MNLVYWMKAQMLALQNKTGLHIRWRMNDERVTITALNKSGEKRERRFQYLGELELLEQGIQEAESRFTKWVNEQDEG